MHCTETEIENWLRDIKGWVPDAIICQTFQVNERRLRWDRGKPGLLSVCAISHSQKGFKHVANATDEEFAECDKRDRKSCASRYIALRKRRVYRRNQVRLVPPPICELHSGQRLLFPIIQPREDANAVHH
jgi:hypothetical protein